MAKQYGLIKPDKSKVIITRPSIFNTNSDSEDEEEKPTGITELKRKDRLTQEKSIAEDSTIYQYDELYDDMQAKRKDSKLARKDLDRKPKYISKLLESAERRKRENERRIERDVQKEREAEGDTYKDKDSFVTSAYRKKLEEMKQLEEKEKREEYLEAIGDVRKQSDLSGFYRHLYEQQVKYDENENSEDESPKKQEKPIPELTEPVQNPPKINETKKRKYRKRQDSKSENESETEVKLEHLPSNLDADSDFSIDSSDSEQEDKPKKPEIIDKSKPETNETVQVTCESNDKEETKAEIPSINKKTDVEEETKMIKREPEVEKKPKIDIWKKRTVESTFDEALKKFYERKAARLQPI